VRYTGGDVPQLGTITSARGGYLKIRLDGDQHAGTYHPTWEIQYLNSEPTSATTEPATVG